MNNRNVRSNFAGIQRDSDVLHVALLGGRGGGEDWASAKSGHHKKWGRLAHRRRAHIQHVALVAGHRRPSTVRDVTADVSLSPVLVPTLNHGDMSWKQMGLRARWQPDT